MSQDSVLQFEPIFHIMVAEQIVDDVLLGYVIGASNVVMRDDVLAQQFARGAVANASEHSAEFIDRNHVGEGAESFFVVASCHNILLLNILSMAEDTVKYDVCCVRSSANRPPIDLRFPPLFEVDLKNRMN